MNARIMNVIVVENGDEITYFTLEGVEIGGLRGGHRVESEMPVPPESPKGGVVTAPHPKSVKRSKQKQAEKDLTLENRLQYEKDHIA